MSLRRRQRQLVLRYFFRGIGCFFLYSGFVQAEVQELARSLSLEERQGPIVPLVNEYTETCETIVVLARLQSEKRTELRNISKELELSFGIHPAKNYRFDLNRGAIIEVEDESTQPKAEEGIPLSDPKQKDRFIKLYTAKRLTEVTLSSLQFLEKEKATERNLIKSRLIKNHALDPKGSKLLLRNGSIWRIIPKN